MAARAELWHICVFIVAQGMENGAGEGAVRGGVVRGGLLQDHSGSVYVCVCCCEGPDCCY